MIYLIPIAILIAALVAITLFVAAAFRVVVSTNEVHIIQKKKTSISYGKGQEAGNVYYAFPSWIPVIGISRIVLPVSNFDISLDAYEAFDQNKVPFRVDKGMTSLLDVFSGKGGASMASMLENLNNSDLGKDLIGKFLTPKKMDTRTEAELKAE